MRKVYEIANQQRRATVYRNSEWQCFTVKFYARDNGEWKHLTNADYESDEKQEAIDTAAHWVNA